MLHSSIKAGLCAVFASAAALTGSALAQEATPAPLQAEAAHRLALHAAEGLPVERHLAFQARLDDCASDMGACAALLADLRALELADMDGSAPVRFERSTIALLPGSDGRVAGPSSPLASAAQSASQQAVDTDRPVVESLTVTPEEVNVDAGETTIWIDYEISDEGGSFLEMMILDLEHVSDRTAPSISGGVYILSGARAAGRARITLSPGVLEGEYRVRPSIFDNAGNYNDLSQPMPTVMIYNSNSDAEAPVLNSLSLTPDPLTLNGADGELSVTYDVSDQGVGLQYLSLGLRHVDTPSYQGTVSGVNVPFNGENEGQGVTTISVPSTTPPGEYYLSVLMMDRAGNSTLMNHENPEAFRTLTIINAQADTLPPVINRLTLTPDAIEASGLGATVRVDYDVQDEGGSGLNGLSLTLGHEESAKRQSTISTDFIDFDGASSAQGSFTWRIPPNYPTGAYLVGASMRDEANNQLGGGRAIGLASTQILWINEPGKRAFGPFPGVVEPDGAGRDIFRIAGLETGPPNQIQVAFRDAEVYGFEGALSDCTLSVRPERYSGAEYLILAQDLAECGPYGSADIVFEITPAAADLDQRITLRRFRVSQTGMLTDLSYDRSPHTHWVSDREEARFGPFEWTESDTSIRMHHFRLSGLSSYVPESMDVAIANASAEGFDGEFTDCTLPINFNQVSLGVYAFSSADLSACGAFGRADLSFRMDRVADYDAPVILTRTVTTPDGSVTDFSFDILQDVPIQPVATSGDRAQIEAGPFEWTGDANAPTQNLFRISGLSGEPDQIEIAISNAAATGYDGAYTDCNLDILPQRAGANDYMISASDLAQCGAFGRADLSFRITAAAADMPDGVRMRRIAIGAHGDLTDFSFDHDVRPTGEIRESGDGQSNIVLGPFEWTGDHTVGTQNVFRLTGISGVPTRIQASLNNATEDGYAGSYLDCELTIRPERASANDYVIASNDLADCGNFSRADITFRVFANTENFQSDVRMRRFAVTRTGGLTDFGFDNQ
ncbi:hypothetical protein ABWI01_05410 [Oceanicaulis alexandrii]|uniref:hypothetical protein n=1 Tax=Oceanicaulis alexandrii TaxID=153233 RepID=UPI0035D05794